MTQTQGIFTVVQDGGESTLLVATQVPYSQVTLYRDWLTGAGLVASSVQFKDVGTSLKVRATILPGNQVRVRVTPSVSWFSADTAGSIEVTVSPGMNGDHARRLTSTGALVLNAMSMTGKWPQ